MVTDKMLQKLDSLDKIQFTTFNKTENIFEIENSIYTKFLAKNTRDFNKLHKNCEISGGNVFSPANKYDIVKTSQILKGDEVLIIEVITHDKKVFSKSNLYISSFTSGQPEYATIFTNPENFTITYQIFKTGDPCGLCIVLCEQSPLTRSNTLINLKLRLQKQKTMFTSTLKALLKNRNVTSELTSTSLNLTKFDNGSCIPVEIELLSDFSADFQIPKFVNKNNQHKVREIFENAIETLFNSTQLLKAFVRPKKFDFKESYSTFSNFLSNLDVTTYCGSALVGISIASTFSFLCIISIQIGACYCARKYMSYLRLNLSQPPIEQESTRV